MAERKTSAEIEREKATEGALDNLLDGAFADANTMKKTGPSSPPPTKDPLAGAFAAIEESKSEPEPEKEAEEKIDILLSSPTLSKPTGPPGSPPSNPPTKAPSGPPGKPPSSPPKSPPSGPPTGPSTGPLTGPPSGPPADAPENSPDESETTFEEITESNQNDEQEVVEATEEETVEEAVQTEQEIIEEELPEIEEKDDETEDPEVEIETAESEPKVDQQVEEKISIEEEKSEAQALENEPQTISQNENMAEEEIARLQAEIERLRTSITGAVEIIEELEEPQQPPAVIQNIIVPDYIVASFSTIGRQLSREGMAHGSMGGIAMLHPDSLGVMISSKHMATLSRMDERSVTAGMLGEEPPRGARDDWKVLEVLLASVSLLTGGPAAVIHAMGPYTTTASCEKDLVLVKPIDEMGKKHIGSVVIVDPDEDDPAEYLRQVAEALQQGGMRAVVIRGYGAYAVGADFDQAMSNASMLEHSMQIVLLARQAGMKF